LKEIGLANTKISDKSVGRLMFATINYTRLEVINLESNSKIGFTTASFILQQLCNSPNGKITLREVFLEYTKVSIALSRCLEEALFNYQEGNYEKVNQISKRHINKGKR
jgi:hypothetical protein